MILISKNRGEGKTTELVKMSAKTGHIIVVPHDGMKRVVLNMADRIGLKIPSPITKREMNLAQYRGYTFLIDELESFINDGFYVYAATINKENISEESDIAVLKNNINILMGKYSKAIKNEDFNGGLNILKNIDLLNKQIEWANRIDAFKSE